MSAQKLSDLLPIGDTNSAPHPYQIFGLEAGEQDLPTIASAVQATVARLRGVKDATPPALWKQAAQLVQAARVTLADPAKKAELDARFGIIAVDETPSPTTAAQTPAAKVDPLAGMLPPSNPLAPVTAASTPTPVATPEPNAIPPGIFGAPSGPAAATPVQQYVAPAAIATPVIRKVRPIKTRRRSMVGTLMMGTFLLGMLAAIGVLSYFLLFGPGSLAITSKDGSLTISTGPGSSAGSTTGSTSVADPRPLDPDNDTARPRRFDPVMGKMGGDMEPPQPSITELQPSVAPEVAAEQMNASVQDMNQDGGMSAGMTAAPTVASEVTAADIAKADAEIARVTSLLRQPNWSEMKSAAEATQRLPMQGEQKIRVKGLYQLADLATYYRGGVEKGVESLQVGNDFEVTSDFRVVIVEVGADFLVVRYNAMNRTFKFDEFPLSLANRLATFSIPEGPTRQASMAAYQAIAPVSDQGYREEAIQILGTLSGQVEDVDTAAVIEAIKLVHP
ncbi:hypothetical protein Poly51_29590 [Rubripirellula tenax]|uniref:Uncharacterized protein n=1 Tax=Rubripirellula tenax TaxID=2528015 RepID=A0A5C6F6N6_9BACT|nr:hypothetical protein [Rubripirellula tenax]TWU57038.1 hypothetical protein Poly51_29590 [Rubripirellula tenax]